NAIVNEAYNTLQEQGLTVDIRHIMLVSDMMTNDGDVKAIGRHGISGRKSSVLARAAFEITAHHLLRAAITGEVDYLDGVAENVVLASNCPPEAARALGDIRTLRFPGTNVDLGAACGVPFSVAAVAVLSPGESNILSA